MKAKGNYSGLDSFSLSFSTKKDELLHLPGNDARMGRINELFDAGRTLRAIDQTGDFRFEQGKQRAFADSAHYESASETVTLLGRPRIEDEETHAKADRILLNSSTGDAEGVGHVQTSHLAVTAAPRSRTTPLACPAGPPPDIWARIAGLMLPVVASICHFCMAASGMGWSFRTRS